MCSVSPVSGPAPVSPGAGRPPVPPVIAPVSGTGGSPVSGTRGPPVSGAGGPPVSGTGGPPVPPGTGGALVAILGVGAVPAEVAPLPALRAARGQYVAKNGEEK